MKILILANKVPFPSTDGGAIATLNMAKGLVTAGASIKMIAISTPKHPTQLVSIPIDLRNTIDFSIVNVDTSLSFWDAAINLLFTKKPYNAQRFVDKGVEDMISLALNSQSFDLVQLEGLYMAPYIPLLRKKTDAPISLRAHNVEWEIWDRTASFEKNLLKRLYFKLLAKRVKRMEIECLQGIDLLVPISLRDESMLKEMGFEGPALTSPTGFDLSMLSPCSNAQEGSNIFHLGGLDWIPNQEGLLWFLNECWGKLLLLKPDVHFHIAGRNAPKSFIDSISQYPNVTFWGEVPDSREFICSKGVMIVPLLSGSGMRIKIVEGMALGKTIVSTGIGAEGISATDGQDIFIADTPELFIQRIFEALTDKKASNNMGKNARDYALLNFDNNIIVAKLFDFYRNQLSKRSSN